MTKLPRNDFVFKKHMNVGEADAENDAAFLAECFIDIGDYEVLKNTDNAQAIILGRTGVGKSALIEHLENSNEQVIRIEPEELALRHISNSTILRFFEDLGVNLDIFYNLLWQHTFAVELIQKQYGINSIEAKTSFISRIKSLISGDHKKQQALDYIEEWGDKFWEDTETRIIEFTDKLETDLKSSIDSKVPGINISTAAGAALTEEQKTEVVHYGKKVVSTVQIQKLSKIVNLLADDVFNDSTRKVYIVIDRLDENWVEDELRYKLIRALIETVRKFRNIEPVKIIFTLRTDLLDRVLEKTRDSGFQPEKYNSFYLTMGWTRENLKCLLDKRINHLLKQKYTNSNVYFEDIFPAKIDKTTSLDYILDRTLLRPRDAIMFVNKCLIEAQGKTEITSAIIKKAEQAYSLDRLESLRYEWMVEHPNLEKYLSLLHQSNASFKVNLINDEVENLMLEFAVAGNIYKDAAVEAAHNYVNAKYPDTDVFKSQFIQNLLFILYKIGIIGIKIDGTSSVTWVHNRTQSLSAKKIKNTSIIYVHKMLWRALAIDKRA